MASFDDHPAHIHAVIAAVRAGCDPFEAMVSALQDRTAAAPALSIAVGKAAPAMDAALGRHVSPGPRRLIICPERVPLWGRTATVLLADHPTPTARNIAAAETVIQAIQTAKQRDARGAIALLLSGGASALLTHPPPGLDLFAIRAVTRALLAAGAPIQDLNCVRKHLETLKGGRLAALAAPLAIDAFILSDVLGDRLDVVGSGPASPDPTTYTDALAVLERFRCIDASRAVSDYLKAGIGGAHPETPKPGDPIFDRTTTRLIGNNATAVAAAAAALDELAPGNVVQRCNVEGEAAQVGADLARAALSLTANPPSSRVIVWGGETTVTVGHATGRGGRNQELALAAAIAIDGRPNIAIATFATDGIDGPTDAAGAIVTGQTCPLARRLGLDPRSALPNHDSHTFFAALDKAGHPHLIRTGPTGTNVNDIALALVYP